MRNPVDPMLRTARSLTARYALLAAVLLVAAATLRAGAAAAPGAGAVAADSTAAQTEGAGLPASLAGFEDEGVFHLYVNEESIVKSEFSWAADGSYRGSYTLSMAGQTATTTMTVEVDDEGLWTGISMETPLGPVTVRREGALAVVERRGDTTAVNLREGTVLFENFNPALMAQAIRSYDEELGGKQTVPIFIVPSVVMNGTIERLDPVERAVHGRDVTLVPYVYGLPGVDVTVYVDGEGRVVFGDVPQQHAAYVREGFEALLEAEEDTLVSRPEFDFAVDRNVGVPMRDGIELATDIYRPVAEGKFPVILVRTPYKKEMHELQAKFFARRGYAFAVQDCRGRFSSPGEWEPFVNEPADGYDTVEWLAAQPWSTGKVGMIGASYLGWVQWWAARDNPPHLVTIIPNVSPPDPYFNIPYEYGVFFMLGSIWWADVLESEATADITGKGMSYVSDKKYASLLKHLPVIDLDIEVLGKKNPYWREWIAHPDNDEYWERASFLDHLEGLDIPVFHQSGWFDGDGIGSKLNYLKMASHGHRYQKLVLGPWPHTDKPMRRLGDLDFGEEAIVDLQREYLRWLDHWLKGVDNGIEKEPLVSVFVMGSNEWLHGNTYPLEGTKMTEYYLVSGGSANTSNGDGLLSPSPPPADSPPDRYVYDPGDPTPAPYYYVSEELEEEDAGTDTDEAREQDRAAEDGAKGKKGLKTVEEEIQERRSYYAKIDSLRQDILVYETTPLEEPLTFVGPVSAVLYAASSAPDTDWFMRLSRVDARGRVYNLVEGKIRARYRKSFEKPELLKPGETYEYHLDLWQTGVTIAAGERLRVEVASASFPVFSRNLNTGEHNETTTEYVKATQTVYHDREHPSHILLPVVEQ